VRGGKEATIEWLLEEIMLLQSMSGAEKKFPRPGSPFCPANPVSPELADAPAVFAFRKGEAPMSTITETKSPVQHGNPAHSEAVKSGDQNHDYPSGTTTRLHLPSGNPFGPSWANLHRDGANVRSIKPSGLSWANLHRDGANVRSTKPSGSSWANLLKR
jgi:hypothetical protein